MDLHEQFSDCFAAHHDRRPWALSSASPMGLLGNITLPCTPNIPAAPSARSSGANTDFINDVRVSGIGNIPPLSTTELLEMERFLQECREILCSPTRPAHDNDNKIDHEFELSNVLQESASTISLADADLTQWVLDTSKTSPSWPGSPRHGLLSPQQTRTPTLTPFPMPTLDQFPARAQPQLSPNHLSSQISSCVPHELAGQSANDTVAMSFSPPIETLYPITNHTAPGGPGWLPPLPQGSSLPAVDGHVQGLCPPDRRPLASTTRMPDVMSGEHSLAARHASSSTGSRRGLFRPAVVRALRQWLESHREHPYPTVQEKKALAMCTGLTIEQINYWFINARRRHLRLKKGGPKKL